MNPPIERLIDWETEDADELVVRDLLRRIKPALFGADRVTDAIFAEENLFVDRGSSFVHYHPRYLYFRLYTDLGENLDERVRRAFSNFEPVVYNFQARSDADRALTAMLGPYVMDAVVDEVAALFSADVCVEKTAA